MPNYLRGEQLELFDNNSCYKIRGTDLIPLVGAFDYVDRNKKFEGTLEVESRKVILSIYSMLSSLSILSAGLVGLDKGLEYLLK